MKTKILILILACCQLTAFSQTYKKYLPYKHQNLWGVIDTAQQIIIKAQYKEVKILGKLDYVEFDGKHLFDINNGVTIESNGNYVCSVEIGGKHYFLFNTENNSILINLKRKDTINLSLKYENMFNVSMVNPKTKNKSDYIIGKLASEKYVLLKNNKQLPLAIKKKFDNFDFMNSGDYRSFCAFVAKTSSKSYVYNDKLKLISSLVSTDKYEVLSTAQLPKLDRILKVGKLNLSCFLCAEIESSEWDFPEDPILPEVFTVEYRSNRLSVTYKPNDGKETEVFPSFLYGIKTIQFGENEIIIDNKYVKPKVLMFPKAVLKN